MKLLFTLILFLFKFIYYYFKNFKSEVVLRLGPYYK